MEDAQKLLASNMGLILIVRDIGAKEVFFKKCSRLLFCQF